MTERERLIDLLRQKCARSGCKGAEEIARCENCENGIGIADYLLANGVIVPPCKVGDMVWLIKSLNWQQTEWGIKEGKISMIQQKADNSWKFRVTENHSVQDYTVDRIGKTVFLTKEEAVKALKGAEGK